MTATIYGAPEGYDALLLARRTLEHRGSILHVTRDDARMARLAEALAFFAPDLVRDVEILRFPAWDCLPYDRVSPNPELVSERIATPQPPARAAASSSPLSTPWSSASPRATCSKAPTSPSAPTRTPP